MQDICYDGLGLLAAIHDSAALGKADALVKWRYFDFETQLYGGAVTPRRPGLRPQPHPSAGAEA